MQHFKHGITFCLNKVKERDGTKEGTLRCVVTWNGQRVRLSLPYVISEKGWNAEDQCCRPRTTHGRSKTPAAVINNEIEKTANLVNDIFDSFANIETIPNTTEFKEEYNKRMGRIPQIKETTVSDVFGKYIAYGTSLGKWRPNTIRKIEIVKSHVDAMPFLTKFEDFDNGAMSAMLQFYSTKSDRTKGKGLVNPTIKKEIAVIKSFLRWASENGYCEAPRFLSQRSYLKNAKNVVIFLDWDELMSVYDFNFGDKHYLAQVRDVFCFCCFTSLRYSDVNNLKRSDVTENHIRVTTVKTDDTLIIELNKYAKAILAKYEDLDFPNDRALPVISNQKMNTYLKKMGEVCGLNSTIRISTYKGVQRIDKEYKKYELLTTHAGRRTFICNALMLGIPPNVVMKWTGHSDYKAMLPYIDIADKAKQDAMSVFDNAESIHAKSRGGKNGGQKCGDKCN